MAFKRLDAETFKSQLRQYLTPARAIASPQHLKGRAKTLTQIERAFNSDGKHIFIYGDRGVGKTSLAQTAAYLRQSSDARPLLVSCGGARFLDTVRDAVKQSLPAGDAVFQKKVEHKLKAGIGGFGYDMTRSLTSGVLPPFETLNDAVQLLSVVSELLSREPVIIFDEFDQLADDAERKVCAELIKAVSDRSVGVRFIFCGIGTSLEDLIGVHLSTGRYLSPVQLDRLTHDARWQIVEDAAQAIGVTISRPHQIRIGQISDGFPSYVHLMTEQILWSMYDDPVPVGICSQEHFASGVRQAVQETETTLKIIYDRATQKYSDDYQEVLWALADDHLLRRQTTDIYEKSYLRIMGERRHRKRLTKRQFSDRLNKLKTSRHGEIILGKGAGWYEFRENIVRGYVRLRAENEGVRIGTEGYG
ncbi:ATP-binding protein [Pararoseomonas sp. SCSIO 73927]|uniref:ATP-binding protein n=1 Tax=Pararoseomonas sp. SCSIO 73927 TaxID=3114537 RepID=UPI0030CD2785